MVGVFVGGVVEGLIRGVRGIGGIILRLSGRKRGIECHIICSRITGVFDKLFSYCTMIEQKDSFQRV